MGRSAEAWGRQDDSGMNECEEYGYHHAEVCVYCGKRREDKLQCCSEVHFDTQFNIDKNEKRHEKTRRIINEIHNIVETQIDLRSKPF